MGLCLPELQEFKNISACALQDLKKKKNSIHVLIIFMRWYRSWCCTVQHFGNDFIMTSSCFYRNSHFHLDHCGALPYFSEMVGYDGPIYMTHPTKAICPILLVSWNNVKHITELSRSEFQWVSKHLSQSKLLSFIEPLW